MDETKYEIIQMEWKLRTLPVLRVIIVKIGYKHGKSMQKQERGICFYSGCSNKATLGGKYNNIYLIFTIVM